MKTHFAPCAYGDLDEIERSACGTWLGGLSNLTRDWSRVDCGTCLKRREKITKQVQDEELAIVQQMGDMADFMKNRE